MITTAQISQMVVGTFIQIASMALYRQDPTKCSFDFSNLVAGALMYGSYFALFFQFALERFVFKGASKGKGGKAQKEA